MATKTKATFDTVLPKFINSVKNTQKLAQTCSELAIVHYKEHGDLSYCQRFLDAIHDNARNFVRKAAFLKWLAAHSPITMEEGKLKKDTSKDATVFNIEGALATPFWMFAPDPENVLFMDTDIVVSLERAVKRFEKSDHFKPKDAKATATLKAAHDFVAGLKTKTTKAA